ncbi:antitoxin Xre/MbcA/ParS toxin-binding domain-containing protein [Pacificimonas flava]|uniref:Antitoxin Xre/MbcA/ParS-like toxin-binding domain-containing protein n=1 Tax=Pacificimonas flava TaxID=1234595 RepID=M2SAK8_9SPHN|nr:DUF2384 domain-containing protein [Pacificimonas flava]EMD82390.1 hypothetical protein C725_2111 [Pacificimonas flava]MBB5281224.1 hypothetical protein [Pacificimonas flava]
MVRASCIIGIFRCLRIIFNGPLAYGWMTHSNKGPLFNGNRPIDVINAGGPEDLVKVREHLLHLGGGCIDSGMEDEFEPDIS